MIKFSPILTEIKLRVPLSNKDLLENIIRNHINIVALIIDENIINDPSKIRNFLNEYSYDEEDQIKIILDFFKYTYPLITMIYSPGRNQIEEYYIEGNYKKMIAIPHVFDDEDQVCYIFHNF